MAQRNLPARTPARTLEARIGEAFDDLIRAKRDLYGALSTLDSTYVGEDDHQWMHDIAENTANMIDALEQDINGIKILASSKGVKLDESNVKEELPSPCSQGCSQDF